MKLLKSILILILMCVCTCAYAMDEPEEGTYILNGNPAPYNIGVLNKIELPNAVVIKYENRINELNHKEVILKGSIEFSRRIVVLELNVDYYILDADENVARVTNLNLIEEAPGVYGFEYKYPLNLEIYSGDIFDMFLIGELLPQTEI